jgi:lipoate-protein ligase A
MTSPSPIRFINLGRAPSWKTQAAYQSVAELMIESSPDTVILCRPASPYLCIGYHQSARHVLDMDACSRYGLPVYRRKLGGGTTYLDGDQLFYQCIFHRSRVPARLDRLYAMMLSGPLSALRSLGVKATLRDTNEIEADGRRIAGTGGGWIDEAAVIVGNVLFAFDYEAMIRVWRAPWDSFRTLAGQALREHLATVTEFTGPVAIATVERVLLNAFAPAFGRRLVSGALTGSEEERAIQIGQEIGAAPCISMHDSMHNNAVPPLKISAGVYIHGEEVERSGATIRASYEVHQGLIRRAILESAGKRLNELECELHGVVFDRRMEVLHTATGERIAC